MVKADKYYEAVGRRKNAVARVRLVLTSSKGAFTVNDKALDKYFSTVEQTRRARRPLLEVAANEKLNVSVKVRGGGLEAQAEAVAHGLARALTKYEVSWRPVLKRAELFRRDPRVKERRKFGLKKARKAPQWSKR